MKRSIYEKPLIYPARYLAEDWVMSVQFAYYSTKTVVIEDRLYHYFANPNSQRLAKDKTACINKCKEESANIELIINWLRNINLYSNYREEVVKRAMNSKMQLINVLDDYDCQMLWKKTFEQYNLRVFFNKYIRPDQKRIHALLMLRLYRLAKRFVAFLRFFSHKY